jgi:pentatricopeptide repeat protein
MNIFKGVEINSISCVYKNLDLDMRWRADPAVAPGASPRHGRPPSPCSVPPSWDEKGIPEGVGLIEGQAVPTTSPSPTLVPPAIRRSLADPVPRNARVCNAFALKNRTLDDVRRTTTALIKRLGWREGRACMDEMIRVEARPNVIVCSALITACGRDGDADEALAVFEEMRAMGIEPDVHAFSALIWACAKGEHPEKALEIFQEMRDEGRIKPNAYTFNSLLMACAKLGHADKAVWAFNTMQDAGVRPDDATYDALIAACEKQGRADLSSEALEDAVAFKVYQEALGYDPKSGILDFHAGPIVTNPTRRPEAGIAVPVAQALFKYHFRKGHIVPGKVVPGTLFIVGQHGVLKPAIEQCIRDIGWTPTDFVDENGKLNPGRIWGREST